MLPESIIVVGQKETVATEQVPEAITAIVHREL